MIAAATLLSSIRIKPTALGIRFHYIGCAA
jgi:hypothetical protein